MEALLGYLFIFLKKSEKDFQKAIDKCIKIEYNIIRLAQANRSKTLRACGKKLLEVTMNLLMAEEGKEYIIRAIETDDDEMDAFLFSLGCYSGEPITVISHRKGSCVVSIKDGRYSIDSQLAAAILI